MKNALIVLLIIGSSVFASNCSILTENTVGTVNSDLLDLIVDESKQKESIENHTAFFIKKGTTICDTNKKNG